MNESRRRSNVVLLIADLEIVDKHHIFFNKYELKKEVELRWSPSKPSFGSALLAPGLAVGRRLHGAPRQLRTKWRLPVMLAQPRWLSPRELPVLVLSLELQPWPHKHYYRTGLLLCSVWRQLWPDAKPRQIRGVEVKVKQI